VTTVLNARLSPLVNRYLDSLQALLQENGLKVPILVSQNNGGLTDRLRAGREAIFTLFSGPAGGAKGGWALAQNTGLNNLVIADMGGTSLDISLIREGRMEITQHAEIAGYPVQIPMLDIHTLGAGGGSIAWLDGAGMLQVGPQSAGANPGPACYGLGGNEPTITDATLILGLLESQDFLGGKIELDKERAYHAIQETIAKPLKVSVEEAAYAIYRIALSRMVDALYLMTVKKGYDPRLFTLVATGGALPLFATALARGTGIQQVIVPDSAPVFCADGLHYGRLQVELVRSVLKTLDEWTPKYASEMILTLQNQADSELNRLGVDPIKRRYFGSADLKYSDQHHTINVGFDWEDSECWARLAGDFHLKHHHLYGYSQPGNDLQLVNLRLFAQEADLELNSISHSTFLSAHCEEPSAPQPDGYRLVFINGQTPNDLPVFDWDHLMTGQSIEGPAIIRKPLTTLFLDSQSRGEIDPTGNFRITIGKAGDQQ
jgi:N-methylhydantoinase A